jgi:hypothetical protein
MCQADLISWGQLNIDTNLTEKVIKRFVIGPNYSYSIVETAKANDLIPFDYLHDVISVSSEHDDDETLNKLLPWNIRLKRR